MSVFPCDITDSENGELSHPFLPSDEYQIILQYPEGGAVLLKDEISELSWDTAERLADLSRKILDRRNASVPT